MSNVTKHKFKFKHNENFYTDIRSGLDNYVDWQIISLYYSLLHLINGYHAKYYPKEPINGHKELSDFVEKHFSNYLSRFEDLLEDCMQVRYNDCTDCSNREQILLRIHKPFFDRFKNLVESQL